MNNTNTITHGYAKKLANFNEFEKKVFCYIDEESAFYDCCNEKYKNDDIVNYSEEDKALIESFRSNIKDFITEYTKLEHGIRDEDHWGEYEHIFFHYRFDGENLKKYQKREEDGQQEAEEEHIKQVKVDIDYNRRHSIYEEDDDCNNPYYYQNKRDRFLYS